MYTASSRSSLFLLTRNEVLLIVLLIVMITAKTIDDCRLCPPGRWGATKGLETKECSGMCAAGKYSKAQGATAISVWQFYSPLNSWFWWLNFNSKIEMFLLWNFYSKIKFDVFFQLLYSSSNFRQTCIVCPFGYFDWQCGNNREGFYANAVIEPRGSKIRQN